MAFFVDRLRITIVKKDIECFPIAIVTKNLYTGRLRIAIVKKA